jgi:CDP-diacylglycerol--glycerol-3-phosphate 3-phosphatidyltransferase
MINGITLYRLVAAPVLLLLAVGNLIFIFKFLLVISFLSDAMDGFLARKYKVESQLGSKLDSIADDLTVAAAGISLFLYKPSFIHGQLTIIILLLLLYVVQTILALIRYGKISSFHTYLAKTAALLQGLFLVLIFFTEPALFLFYIVALVTAIDLIEEIILVLLLPHWQANIKGLYWVLKRHAVKPS